MKARSKKIRLGRAYAQVLKNKPRLVEETVTPKASIFASVVESLLSKSGPIPELIDDNLDVVIEKRPRGRPKKFKQIVVDGKVTHKIEGDDAIVTTTFSDAQVRQMIADFKVHHKLHEIPLGRSIERISQSYKISYKQAFTMLENEGVF